MTQLIATLESPLSKQCALAIIDSDKGVLYLQRDQLSPRHQVQTLRGISLTTDQLYVVTACSLLVYQLEPSPPFFRLQKEIVLPEWILGGKSQANLYPVTVSQKRQRIYVGNNLLASIDELTLEGEFLKRHHLWDIAPDSFYTPEKTSPEFQYGHIRNIHETPNGSVYLTVALCRQTDEGLLIDLDTGLNILSVLNHPSGGIVDKDSLYILNSRKGELHCYGFDEVLNSYTLEPRWIATPPSLTTKSATNHLNLRGLTLHKNTLYCGVCDFSSPLDKQIPPYIAGFDKTTGKHIQNISMPNLTILRNPRIFTLSALPDNLINPNSDHLTCFFHNKEISPENYKIKPSPEEPFRDLIKSQYCFAPFSPKSTERIPSIKLENVGLCYRRSAHFFLSRNKRLRETREYWALRNLSLTIYENDTVGLIGRNGSGKSTTSMIISGALRPDTGTVTTKGRVQLLALGIGFRPQLTGRENVIISGTILGMSRKDIKSRIDEIEEFSELGDFFDEPIRTYSAGMKSRLGFAVSTAVQPDILILDEVMSTGDAAFRIKANRRMEDMRKKTKTVIVVSHSPTQVRELCSRVVWLERGRPIMDGPVNKVLPLYEKFCKNPEQWLEENPSIVALLNA